MARAAHHLSGPNALLFSLGDASLSAEDYVRAVDTWRARDIDHVAEPWAERKSQDGRVFPEAPPARRLAEPEPVPLASVDELLDGAKREVARFGAALLGGTDALVLGRDGSASGTLPPKHGAEVYAHADGEFVEIAQVTDMGGNIVALEQLADVVGCVPWGSRSSSQDASHTLQSFGDCDVCASDVFDRFVDWGSPDGEVFITGCATWIVLAAA